MFAIYIFVVTQFICANADTGIDEIDSSLYQIEGKVYGPELQLKNILDWQRNTVVTINNGEYSGFLKEDGTFVISAIPTGSYVVEIVNPDYYYESVNALVVFVFSSALLTNCLFSMCCADLGEGRD